MQAPEKTDDDLIETYRSILAQERISPSTLLCYSSDLKKLAGYLARFSRNLSVCSQEDVLGWLDESGCGASTKARKIAMLRGFYKRMRDRSFVRVNPVEAILVPRGNSEPRKVLGLEEAKILFGAFDRRTIRGIRDYAMAHVFFAARLSAGELVRLSLSDVEQVPVGYIVRRGEQHRALLQGEPEEALHAYLRDVRPSFAGPASAGLFLTDRGKTMTRQSFWKIMRQTLRVAGLKTKGGVSVYLQEDAAKELYPQPFHFSITPEIRVRIEVVAKRRPHMTLSAVADEILSRGLALIEHLDAKVSYDSMRSHESSIYDRT